MYDTHHKHSYRTLNDLEDVIYLAEYKDYKLVHKPAHRDGKNVARIERYYMIYQSDIIGHSTIKDNMLLRWKLKMEEIEEYEKFEVRQVLSSSTIGDSSVMATFSYIAFNGSNVENMVLWCYATSISAAIPVLLSKIDDTYGAYLKDLTSITFSWRNPPINS